MTTDDETPRHRIGAVARLTGISTHALRVWERRYGTLKPQRSDGGDRLYSDGDVQRLRMIKRLLGLGHGIGDVARLPAPELAKLLSLHDEPKSEPAPEPALALVERYLEHIERLDLALAEQTLAGAALALPRRELIDQVLVPLLHELGSRWQEGELHVAHEHAASAMVRSQLGAMLRLFAPDGGAPSAVATTPSGEHHELGALMAAVTAAMSGWRSLYLGPNLPVAEVVRAVKSSASDAVLLSCVSLDGAIALPFIAELDAALPPHTTLVLGGHSAQSLTSLPRGVVRVADLAELESWLSGRVSPTTGRRAGRGR
ncbi:MAG: MerR family transcriptional regulator [Polyangiaceae bacterium]|nr:MerR family transcriptional regulator [Polyangiaceae bacterium]MCE7889794.1 MerR family transcriptional regulator [Sorangiineae bacterium PRO1]MCL4752904.1 MerR family transcriptional regulator [Myxococcales bacterium]